MMKHHNRQLLLFAGLYLCQYTALGFIAITLAVQLRAQGASLAQLGILNLILLPVSAKFLWAPLIDRHGHTRHGHYRNWLIPAHSSMFLLLILASVLTPQPTHFHFLFILLFLFAFAVATQDCAADAFASKYLDRETRPKLNTIQVASGMAGNLIGGGIISRYYPQLGWRTSLLILALAMLQPLIALFYLREPSAPNAVAPKAWREIFAFWRGRWAWLLLLYLYSTPFALASLLPPLLVDHAWTQTDISDVLKIYGSLVGLLSAATAVPLIRALGRRRATLIFMGLQSAALIAFLPISLGAAQTHIVYGAVTAFYLAFSPLYAVMATHMMDKAAHSAAPATAYSIQHGASFIFALMNGSLALWLAGRIGYSAVILIACALTLIAAALAYQHLAKDRS